jgi:hypothetical protein
VALFMIALCVCVFLVRRRSLSARCAMNHQPSISQFPLLSHDFVFVYISFPRINFFL